MKPDTSQNSDEARDDQRLDQEQPREPFVLDGGGDGAPIVCASVFGTMPVAAIQAAGSPVTPRRSSAIAVERIGGIQPRQLARSPILAPRSSRKAGIAMRGQPACRTRAELLDHAAERDRLRLHQVPASPLRTAASSMSRAASQAMVAAISSTATGWNGVAISFAGSSSGNAASARSMALPP